jgi:ADP-heptose:LPS heptosyltransferase
VKKILIYSGQDQIGDAIIKLPFLYYLRKEFPSDKIIWMTQLGTVYKKELSIFINDYIDEFYDNTNLNLAPWKKISYNYNLENDNFDLIIDTQKSVRRTLALNRISSKCFISSSANFLFSSIKPKLIKKNNQYYLNDLLELLSLYSGNTIKNKFKLEVPDKIKKSLSKFFSIKNKYFGIAPGAGQDNKIWHIENYIKLAKHFQNEGYKIVIFLGPLEKLMKEKFNSELTNVIYPEDLLKEFNSPQVVMASTNFLKCAVSNDSGTSHMLSTNLCPLIKLFGPKNSIKFTPDYLNKIMNIKANQFGDNNINNIPVDYVIAQSEKIINLNN